MKNIPGARNAMMTVTLLTAALFTSSLALAKETATEEMTFDVSPGARVSLENVNGGIMIEGTNSNQVVVVAEKKAKTTEYLEEIKIEVDVSADHVSIETDLPKSGGGWFSGGDTGASVQYTVSVPSDAVLDSISSVNGDIQIVGVTGTVKAETVNGTIEVEGLEGDGSFDTVNGTVKASFESFGNGQRVHAETVNGRVVLELPANASARVSAETVNGSIDASDFGLKAEKGFVGRDLAGEIGSGEGRISAETVNGSVTIRSR